MQITLPSGTPAEIRLVDGAPRGLVVFPDIFGLRPLFADHVERFATEWGVSTVAIEPFGTLTGLGDVDTRFAAVPSLRDEDRFRDLEEAAAATGCSAVGLIGFCMGGMYCFKSAGLPCFDRIASFYGMIHTPEQWASPSHGDPLDYVRRGDASKVLAVIGSKDHWTPPEHVSELRRVGVTVVEYAQADHGFAHDASRPAHRAEDAADAFARARAWLT
jgi:carboxymethylenebutenolidase